MANMPDLIEVDFLQHRRRRRIAHLPEQGGVVFREIQIRLLEC